MLTTTRRGWWLVFEPALLAFAGVVCGSVSLFAYSHASVIDRDHPSDMSRSSSWTAASYVSADDSDDDGDDDDNVAGDALLSPSIIPTIDEGHDGPGVQIHVPFSLRSERLSSRGPPYCDHDCDTPDSTHRTVTAGSPVSIDDADDDGDDDDDDDDVATALLAAPSALTSGGSHDAPSVQTHVRFSLRSERLSSRGPPRHSPHRDLFWTGDDSTRHRQNSSDDIDDDDDDDDDDDSTELGRSSRTSNRGQTWILILSELDRPFAFASDVHSLRAPPQ